MLVTILLIAESLRIVSKRIWRAQHRADEDYCATSIGGEKYLNRIYTFRATNVLYSIKCVFFNSSIN